MYVIFRTYLVLLAEFNIIRVWEGQLRHLQIQCLLRAHFLVPRWLPRGSVFAVSHGRRGKGTLGSLLGHSSHS